MGDQVTRLQYGFAVRCVARKKMKIAERNGARSFRPLQVNRRLQRRHGHAHIRGIRRDAMFACTQDRERAIVSGDRWTPAAGFTLVAGHRGVSEVHAARPLQ